MPSFQDIPQFPTAHYQIDVDWGMLELTIKRFVEKDGLILEPDFQRAHVWTKKQQIAFVEYQLQGGEVGKNLTFNCPGWMHTITKVRPYEIVDGKQRLEAVRAFLRGDVPVFGHKFSEYSGHLRIFHSFKWRICTLETREEVLQLYLNINAGGTPHTQQELAKVRKMLAAERVKQ